MKTTIALLPLATLASASIARRANCSITCTPSTGAAHIIVSRASTEAAGPGILGYIADDVIEQCPGSDLDSNPCELYISLRKRKIVYLSIFIITFWTMSINPTLYMSDINMVVDVFPASPTDWIESPSLILKKRIKERKKRRRKKERKERRNSLTLLFFNF